MKRSQIFSAALLLASVPATAHFTGDTVRLKEHVYYLASEALLGRGFGTSQGREAAEYIAGRMQEAGIEPLEGSYFHPFMHRTGILNIQGVNVAGIIPGSDPALKDEYIVLGAHYDHLGWKIEDRDTVVYNGADDNASGTASIIEIGRKLAGGGVAPGRSVIIVAFDGEESGLIGSSHFVKDAVIPPEKIRLMFSLDMVGMVEANGGLELHGVELLTDAAKITVDLAANNNIHISKSNSRIGNRTDTAPFGQAGIPAIHVFTGLKSPYHKPEDDANKLDYQGMARVVSFLSDVTVYMSRVEKISDMQPSEQELKAVEEKNIFRAGIRAGIGTGQHIYQEEFYQGKSIFAGEAGFFLQIRPIQVLVIQPEVLYESNGSMHPDGHFRTHAVTIPLNLQISTPGSGIFRSFFQAGGYYTHYFAGTAGGANIDFQDTYEDHGFGINYGVGFEIMKVQWGVSFRKGLTSILRDEDAGRIVNESICFILGYKF
jgi:aminopeptidase YwaD